MNDLLLRGHIGRPETADDIFRGVKNSGYFVDSDNACTISAVYRAVDLIAGALGCFPVKIMEGTKPIFDDIYDLLAIEPNPYMTPITMFSSVQAHALLRGDGFIEIERTKGGVPIALWPIPSDYVEVKVVNNRVVYYVDTARLVDEGESEGVKDPKPISSENMIHIPALSNRGIRGHSIIQEYAGESMSLTKNAEVQQNTFFKNSSRPDSYLKTEQVLNDKTIARIAKSWEERHKGVDNAFRIAVLEAGLEYKSIQLSPADAQLLETRKFQIEEVARWFNVPPHMLKQLDKATFNNIEVLNEEFSKFTMLPWVVKWSQELRRKLYRGPKRKATTVWLSFDILLQPNMLERYKAHQIAISTGWEEVNSVREKEGLPPKPGHDVLLTPVNLMQDTSKGTKNGKDDKVL